MEEGRKTPAQILKKIRALEIKTRGLVETAFAGDYHSVFKGRGMAFSEVRPYQAGDDIRSIDWNVTARTSAPHVKVFTEERELTVVLLVDVSASEEFGWQVTADALAAIGASEDHREGIAAFLEKRPPRWTGR